MHAFILFLLPAVAFAAMSLKTQTSMTKVDPKIHFFLNSFLIHSLLLPCTQILSIRGGKSVGPLNTDNMLQLLCALDVMYGAQMVFAKESTNKRMFVAKQSPIMMDFYGMACFFFATIEYFAVREAKEPFKSTLGKILSMRAVAHFLYNLYERFVKKPSEGTESSFWEGIIVLVPLIAAEIAVFF